MKYLNRDLNVQSGRSMVEMLGVLAVVGVLSIGGIMGYSYAVDKYRANQVLQDIRLIYQEMKYPYATTQIMSGNLPNEIELATVSPYEYGLTIPDLKDFGYDTVTDTTPNLISVNVLGVSETVCNILLKTKPEYTLMLKVNGETTWNCTQDENKLSYIFEITADSLEYGKCSVCTGEYCFDDDMNCPKGENCQNNVCSKCEPGHTENTSGQCTSCSFNRRTDLTKENCHRCGDMMYGYHPNAGSNTNCLPCSQVNISQITKEYCQKCMDKDENVMYVAGACVNCKNSFSFRSNTTKADCLACGEINGNGQFVWYPTKTTNTTGLCVNCNRVAEISANLATANRDNTSCLCPDGQFFVMGADYAGCWSCYETREDISVSKTECDKCSNRYFSGDNERWGACKNCLEGQIKSADGKSCVDKPAS